MIGYAEAQAKVDVAAKTERQHRSTERPAKKPKSPAKKPAGRAGRRRREADRPGRPPPDVTPRLTASGYVFPVYGPVLVRRHVRRAARAHRLGLAPRRGHLRPARRADPRGRGRDGLLGRLERRRRLSPLASRPGRQRVLLRAPLRVLALRRQRPPGQGGHRARLRGATRGDAETTPYHLHFEIHPVGLLFMGYDGAVNPYPYLMAWKRLEDVEFAQVAGWAPPVSPTSSTPKPGAILLSSSDISTADGLDPARSSEPRAPAAKPSRPQRSAALAKPSGYFALSWRYSNSSPSPKTLS